MKRNKGFTLMEILIVIAIIMLLLILAVISFRGQIEKAKDAKRKSDLYTLRSAIENYRTDNDAFPPQDVATDCGGAGLSPYMEKIPCDPTTSVAYGYFLSPSTGGYRVCTILEDTTDPAIEAIGCGGESACGLVGGWNYCLAQGTTASAVGTADEGTGTGYATTPTPTPGNVVSGQDGCTPPDSYGVSHCQYYSDPVASGCPVTFPLGTNCDNQCGNPAVRCK